MDHSYRLKKHKFLMYNNNTLNQSSSNAINKLKLITFNLTDFDNVNDYSWKNILNSLSPFIYKVKFGGGIGVITP